MSKISQGTCISCGRSFRSTDEENVCSIACYCAMEHESKQHITTFFNSESPCPKCGGFVIERQLDIESKVDYIEVCAYCGEMEA